MEDELNELVARVRGVPFSQSIGRVSAVEGNLVEVAGLEREARQGDQVEVELDAKRISAEVLKLRQDATVVFPEGDAEGIALGDKVRLKKELVLSPCNGWRGRIIDPMGRPLDGRPLPRGAVPQRLKADPLPPAQRTGLGGRLETGMAVFNTLLPIVEGQRIGLFAGSGVGKSSLLAHFAQTMEADVVVLALIGERGREVSEFVKNTLGPEGLARTVIVAATSDQSALLRRRCAWTAMAIAEYFRDRKQRVLLLADSLTRFAEAHREVAVAAGEMPSMRGYPASLSQQLMALCERAGPGRAGEGVITAVFSILVAGSDMDEPVADILRGVLDGHTVLDRGIAERGRYPAVDLLRSVSRCLPNAASDDENAMIEEVRYLLNLYEKSQIMIDAGLYEEGKHGELDRAVQAWSELDNFLSLKEPKGLRQSFERLKVILRKANSARETRGLPTTLS